MSPVMRVVGSVVVLVLLTYCHVSPSCGDLKVLRMRSEKALTVPRERADSPAKSRPQLTATGLPPIDLPPGTSSIILNIGANIDPILPSISAGPCAVSIAFEPLVHSQIEHHPQLFVIPAAVSSTRAGMATMYDYGRKSVSSSLSQATRPALWNNGMSGREGGGQALIVPILRLSEVLEVLPRHIPIAHILTDVQGHDFDLIQSGIALIRERNVTTLKTEVFLDQKASFENANNDLCLHWLPLMEKHGYVLETLHPPRPKYGSHAEAVATCREQVKDFYDNRNGTFIKRMKEWDALWRLDTIHEPLGVDYYHQYAPYIPDIIGKHQFRREVEHLFPNFTESEYAQCYENAQSQEIK